MNKKFGALEGVRIVLRVLSTNNHNVSELCFDSNQLATGINYMVFAQPCEEYNNFAAIMKRSGFRHLHLSFLAGFKVSMVSMNMQVSPAVTFPRLLNSHPFNSGIGTRRFK